MSQDNGGQSAKIYVAKRRGSKLRRVALTGVAAICIGGTGSIVGAATGHHELAKEGVAVEFVGLGVYSAGLTGWSKQQKRVVRLKQGQEISGR